MLQTHQVDVEKNLPTKAVKQFPELFPTSRQAAVMMRLWRWRSSCISEDGKVSMRGSEATYTRVTKTGAKRGEVKALAGRGRKRNDWVDALHLDLRSELNRLRHLGVKFNMKTIRALAMLLISKSATSSYSANTLHPGTADIIVTKVTPRWVQEFCERFRIVSRALTGKLQLSPEKEE